VKKLDIRILQAFIEQYFPSGVTPVIKWKTFKNAKQAGTAFVYSNRIYLNPQLDLNESFINVGGGYAYKPERELKYRDGEQYFHTLLHEIGHFIVKREPSAEWVQLATKLESELKHSWRSRDEEWDVEPGSEKEDRLVLQYIVDNARLRRRKGETNERYASRHEDFISWVKGDWILLHIDVERWARREFRRRRKEIRKLLPAFMSYPSGQPIWRKN